jgi:thiamine phosphate synthase YjbQ (UPF0047 family)
MLMKAHTEYLTFHTDERYEMVHITPQVEEIVRRSEVEMGFALYRQCILLQRSMSTTTRMG